MITGLERGLHLCWREMVKWWREMRNPSAFTRFSELPCEMRLMIWESAVPDIPIDQHSACNLWYFRHGETHESKSTSNIDARYQPFGLLRTCHESRAVVLSRMSLLMYETELFARPRPLRRRRLKLVDKTIRTMIPSSKPTNWPRGIPKSFQFYAEFGPDNIWLPRIVHQLNSAPRSHNITTFLCGVIWIPLPYSTGENPRAAPCVDSASAAVPLDDPRLLTYLQRAFRRHAKNMNEDINRECHRKSAVRYLAYWTFVCRKLHQIEGVEEVLRQGYEAKPCVMFGMALDQRSEVLHAQIARLDWFMYRGEEEAEVEKWDMSTPLPPDKNWTNDKLSQARFWGGCQLLGYHSHHDHEEH
ncbi:uncharacterized protein B0J16DRAFT_398322 [Fusarium flagelliforme]|uniref:uncharacterized protein n=1 Tax=Fusarium flagelliforme TaxID=2675880 RepID=UPI001E8ECB0D|nr:uncharacterized protein B0J16DRAFT_398322 [Fusarium flagelliforme]KAH7184825.1 hypothetical protein B0J16DRAFT_398322 [Fusarium flagelliforme]